MGVTVELMPLTTIEKDANEVIIQDVSETIDTSRYSSGTITLRVLKNRNNVLATPGDATIDVEGSDDGQTFSAINDLSITGGPNPGVTVYLNRSVDSSNADYLWRYLRWTITPGDVDLEFCGRITVVLK